MNALYERSSEAKDSARENADAPGRAMPGVLASILVLALTLEAALAHPVLVPRPVQTLTDRLLESDTVVLAREDP